MCGGSHGVWEREGPKRAVGHARRDGLPGCRGRRRRGARRERARVSGHHLWEPGVNWRRWAALGLRCRRAMTLCRLGGTALSLTKLAAGAAPDHRRRWWAGRPLGPRHGCPAAAAAATPERGRRGLWRWCLACRHIGGRSRGGGSGTTGGIGVGRRLRRDDRVVSLRDCTQAYGAGA